MKLLNTFLIAVLFQLWRLKSSQAIDTSPSTNGLKIDQNKLVQLYDKSMSLLAKDFCSKARKLSEQILKDLKVQKAVTSQMQDFKQNITTFLHNYSFFQRYGLYDKLLTIFSDMTIGYYYHKPKNNKAPDSEYILKLLREKGYDTICDDYENKFIEFITLKFLPKFEEFMQQLSKQDLEKRQGLKEFYKEIQKCRNYNCYYTNFNLLLNLIETPKEELFSLINLNLERIMIFYIIAANDIATALIKDQNITQLPSDLRDNLLKDLRDFQGKYENNTKYEKIYDIILFFHENLSLKYYYNDTFAVRDQKFIRDLFDQHGYSTLISYNQILFNEFILQTLPKLFNQFKKYSRKEDLKKDGILLKWYEELQKLQTYNDRVKAFRELNALYLESKI
ncbi:uncharacterized protein ACRADG_005089 [Cochliomyia hominivorax]